MWRVTFTRMRQNPLALLSAALRPSLERCPDSETPPRQGQVESAEVAVNGLMTQLRVFTWCVVSRSAVFPFCSRPAASVSELVSLVFSRCAQIEEHSHHQNLARGFLGLPSRLWGLLGCVSPPLHLLLLWVPFPTFPPNLLWVKALFQQRA